MSKYVSVIVTSKMGSTLGPLAISAAAKVIAGNTGTITINTADNVHGHYVIASLIVPESAIIRELLNTIHTASGNITAVVSFSPGERQPSDRFVISKHTSPATGQLCARRLIEEETRISTKAASVFKGTIPEAKIAGVSRPMIRVEVPGVFTFWMGGISSPNIDIVNYSKTRVRSTMSSDSSNTLRRGVCPDDYMRRQKFCEANVSDFIVSSVRVPESMSLTTKTLNRSEVLRNGGNEHPANLSYGQFAWVLETERKIKELQYVS